MENRKSEFKSTLSLVSILRYSKMYQELKEKYRDMVKVMLEAGPRSPHLTSDITNAY